MTQSDGTPRRARRSLYVRGGRHHVHQVKVSETEEALLQAAAKLRNVTVARLLRDSVLRATEPQVADADRQAAFIELRDLRRLVANIANNVNQIATVANSEGQIMPQLDAVEALAKRTMGRLNGALDRLERA